MTLPGVLLAETDKAPSTLGCLPARTKTRDSRTKIRPTTSSFNVLKKTASGAANTLILLLVTKKKDIHRGRDNMEHKKKQDCHHLCMYLHLSEYFIDGP